MVRFLELDENGDEVWSDTGHFMQSDVHHQYAIVFRTPSYKDPQTPIDVKVFIELVRPSDGRVSERKNFTYKAEDVYKQYKKRKANSSCSSISSSSGGSITNEIPTVLFQTPNGNHDDTEMPIFTIQQLPPIGSPNHCDLGNALGTSMQTMSSPIHTASSPINTMTSSPMNILTSNQTPMWSGNTLLSIPNLQMGSEEFQNVINPDVNMITDEPLTQADISRYMDTFSLNSLSELRTEEHNPLGEFIRASTDLVSDSGRVKVEPSSSNSSQKQSGSENQQTPNSEYDAYYKQGDGAEVKKLVQELCEIIKNKKSYKKQEVRSKLERLFEIRLSNGDTFLHMTLCSKQPSFESIVKIISSVNMSHLLNYVNHRQLTILHLAVFHGSPNLIHLLVSKGCDPMLKNSEDDNVIQYAVRYNMALLSPLLEAIKMYKVPCDLNSCNSEKQTALHLAALSDCETSAKLLLQHGASYNVRDVAGRTPLHLAAYDAKSKVFKVLVEHIPSGDIDVVDGSGNTALQIVCGRSLCPNTTAMIELLMKKGADPLKHEDHNESAWQLTRQYPVLRQTIKPFVTDAALDIIKTEPEDDIKSEMEDDIKSEPEDEDFESADEDMPEEGLRELSQYVREVSDKMDASNGWRELAVKLRADALSNWFANQPSPTERLLHHIKECREDVTSRSLALMLEEMGELEAAKIIRGYLSPNIFD